MNTTTKIITLAAVLTALAGTARAEGFIRPSLLFVSPTMSGASTATGFGLAAGGRFGPKAAHEVSLEGAWVSWDESASYAGYHVSGTLKYQPLLITYRYYFGTAESPARLYLSPTGGFARTTAEVNAIGSDVNLSVGDSTWSAAYGAGAGVAIRLAPRIDLDLGYRYLHVKGSSVTVSGATVTLDDANAHILYAGVSFRF